MGYKFLSRLANCLSALATLYAIVSAAYYGQSKDAGMVYMAALAISIPSAVILRLAARAWGLLFCRRCGRDLPPGMGLDEFGRPRIRMAVITRDGRQVSIGAVCPYCAVKEDYHE